MISQARRIVADRLTWVQLEHWPGAVIELLTGLVRLWSVIQVPVTYCPGCSIRSRKNRVWEEKHKFEKNYDGSSGMKEAA